MIIKILVISVRQGNAVYGFCLCHIPSDEIKGIGKIITIGEKRSGVIKIIFPNRILSLCVTIS